MGIFKNLVAFIEGRLQLDLTYYFKSAPYLAAAQAVAIVCGILLSVAFARLVPKEVYGQYNYLFSILGMLMILTLPGMNTAISQAAARGYDQVFPKGVKLRLKWSLLGSLVAFGIGAFYYWQGSSTLGICLMAAALFFPPYSTGESYESFLYGKKRFGKASLYQSIAKVVSIAIPIAVMFYTKDLLWIVIAYLISFTVINIFFLLLTITREKLNQEVDSESFAFGKHLTAQGVITSISAHLDKIIIGIFLSFQALAIYSIALVAEHAFIPLVIILTMALPKWAPMEKQQAITATKKRMPYLFLGYAVLIAIGILLTPYIIHLLYTTKYSASILYAQLILVSILLEIPGRTFIQLFKSQMGVKELYKIQVFTSLSNIVLLIILVPLFGLMGAIIARIVNRAAVSVISLWLVRG